MTPETYVFGSVYLSLIVVAMLFDSDPIEEFQKCPRCRTEMRNVGSGMGCVGTQRYVVPPILVLTCSELWLF